jgi:hypothetical protein
VAVLLLFASLAPMSTSRADPLDVDTLVPKPHAPIVRIEWVREPDERVVSLSEIEQDHLARQREIVERAARDHDRVISRDRSDVEVLQLLVDRGVFDEEQEYELQALGVALGDAAVGQYDYRWVAYIDERDRTRALKHRETGKVVFPVTAISQRVQSGLPVDVAALFERLAPSERPPGS